MSQTATITVRTKKQLKKEAQDFFDDLWISLSAAVNMFLNDVVSNKTVSFVINKEPYGTLYKTTYDELPEEAKAAYHEVDTLNEDDFIYYTKDGRNDW